jgi:hypothetical protein
VYRVAEMEEIRQVVPHIGLDAIQDKVILGFKTGFLCARFGRV